MKVIFFLNGFILADGLFEARILKDLQGSARRHFLAAVIRDDDHTGFYGVPELDMRPSPGLDLPSVLKQDAKKLR